MTRAVTFGVSLPRPEPPLRFSGVGPTAAKPAASSADRFANWAYHHLDWMKATKTNVNRFNLSLEDWTTRATTLFSIYIPQQIIAMVEDNHVFETLGRNAIVWSAMLGLTVLTKSDKMSINTLLDHFMQERDRVHPKALRRRAGEVLGILAPECAPDPWEHVWHTANSILGRSYERVAQHHRLATALVNTVSPLLAPGQTADDATLARAIAGVLPKSIQPSDTLLKEAAKRARTALAPVEQRPGLPQRMLNPLRLPGSYYDLMSSAGIRWEPADRYRAFWTNLDDNQIDQLLNHYDDVSALKAGGKALTPLQENVLRLTPRFLRRRNFFNVVNVSLIAAAFAVLVGKVALDIVFKYIAPFDHDYDPSRHPSAKGEGKGALPGLAPMPAVPPVTGPYMNGYSPYAMAATHNGSRAWP